MKLPHLHADGTFPVVWRHPEDAGRLWTQDRLHYPDPVTPLEFSLIENGVDAGLTKGARAYGLPLKVHDRHINTYLYTYIESGATAGGDGGAVSTALESAMSVLRVTWDTKWLPEIEQHLAWWAALESKDACPSELLRQLEETEQRWQRLWEIHFLLFFPSKLAISEFVDLYAELFEDEGLFTPYQMLAGYQTKTTESGQWLWAISRRILASPDVVRVFLEHAADDVIARLNQMDPGYRVLGDLDEYLEVHGRRADKLTLTDPYWVEDPVPVIQALQAYLRQPDRDLVGELAGTSRQREAHVTALRSRLQDYPRAVREEVLTRLTAAQEGTYLSEEHGYWIDYAASYCVRKLLLTIGERLVAARVLPQSDDLFYLEMHEVRDLLGSGDGVRRYRTQFDDLVVGRRAEGVRFASVVPPAVLGPGEATPNAEPWDRVEEMLQKVEGTGSAGSEEDLIVGTGGSPGLVEGRAKVIHSLQGAGKLQPGDILVADATSPPWTLLFATAGGLVTNSGGILCHAAVIAREYGIPAVLGTGDATQRLRDGQLVVVDGTQGTVRILE